MEDEYRYEYTGHLSRKGRWVKKKKGFNPTKEEIEKAIKEYLDKGGKITKIETDFSKFMALSGIRPDGAVDEFLMGV